MKVDSLCFSLLLVYKITALTVEGFTCQGKTYSDGLTNCPDYGRQGISSGGNVTIYVKRAVNLPNTDHMPGTFFSDPYVRFIVGNTVRSTKIVKNNLNPDWESEAINLGLMSSASAISIEIWDSDSGVTFSDSLVTTGQVRVPFCSTIIANYSYADCGQPFGCGVTDSTWFMPNRQVCLESGSVSFDDTPCANGGACLFIDVAIVPFAVNIEAGYSKSLLFEPAVSVAAKPYANASFTKHYGYPYLEDSTSNLDFSTGASTEYLQGAIMLRMSNKERAKGLAGSMKFYASINFPAHVYVCRSIADNMKGVPSWLLKSYSAENISKTILKLSGSADSYACFYFLSQGTHKNKWGGVKSGAIGFGANTVSGHDSNYTSDLKYYSGMYIVLFIPYGVTSGDQMVTVVYDSLQFVSSLLSYGLVWAFIMFFTARLLRKINYRVDRLSSHFSSLVLTGDNKNLLAALFIGYDNSPFHIHYRAHVFHAFNCMIFVLCVPPCLLLSGGIAISMSVRPQALGFAVLFLGNASGCFWFGFSLWKASEWRLSSVSLAFQMFGLLLFFGFIVSVVFLDVAVIELGRSLNLTALSLVFGTMNCLPLIVLVFKDDKSYLDALRIFLERMTTAIAEINAGDGADKLKRRSSADLDSGGLLSRRKSSFWTVGADTDVSQTVPSAFGFSANECLHRILGRAYTINVDVPYFRYSHLIQEVKEHHLSDVNEKALISHCSNFFRVMSYLMRPYTLSLYSLFAYVIVAVAYTDFPSLAFLNCLAVILLDFIHLCLSNGDIEWSPGFKVALLVLGRLLVMSSGSPTWIVNYSFAYLIYGATLIDEIINYVLPNVSSAKTNRAVFSHAEDSVPNLDVSSSAVFALFLLTFGFVSVLISSQLGNTRDHLPVGYVIVWGTKWPVYVCGVIALFTLAIGSGILATFRAVYLERRRLLHGGLKGIYMFHKSLTLPVIISFFTELCIIAGGILIFALTGSAAVVIAGVFLPLIILSLGHAGSAWVRNDFELIHWPPTPHPVPEIEDGRPSDIEVATALIKQSSSNDVQLFQVDEEPVESGLVPTLKSFKLPALELSLPNSNRPPAIKMPTLPPKSILRRKRKNMGVKIKQPIVRIAFGNDDAAGVTISSEQNGHETTDQKNVMPAMKSSNNLVENELDQKWNQFTELKRRSSSFWSSRKSGVFAENVGVETGSKKKGAEVVVLYRPAWAQQRWFLYLRNLLTTSPALLFLGRCFAFALSTLQAGTKSATKVYVAPIKTKSKEDPDYDSDEDGDDVVEIPRQMGRSRRRQIESGDIYKTSNELEEPEYERLAKMLFWAAAIRGHLLAEEYVLLLSWFGGLFLILCMGITIAKSTSPAWVGHVIWYSMCMFICTFIPIIKYFNTYIVDDTIKQFGIFVVCVHVIFCASFWGASSQNSIPLLGNLWLLDYFVFFPFFLYICVELFRWRDNGYVLTPISVKGDHQVSIVNYIYHYRVYLFIIIMASLFTWTMYIWVGVVEGQVATVTLIASSLFFLFIRDWASNDHFLSEELRNVGNYILHFVLLVTFVIALFSAQPLFPLSVFFFSFIIGSFSRVAFRIFTAEAHSALYLSPYIMPVYTYNARTNDIQNEDETVHHVAYGVIGCGLWGAAVAVFLSPVTTGVALACASLLACVTVLAMGASHMSLQLNKSASVLTSDVIISAAGAATRTTAARKEEISFDLPSWDQYVPQAKPVVKPPVDKLKELPCLELALSVMSESVALTHVKDDSDYIKSKLVTIVVEKGEDVADADELDSPWYVEAWNELTLWFSNLFSMIPSWRMEGTKRHNSASLTLTDAAAEIFITGRGVLGLLGLDGLWFKLFKYAQGSPRLRFLRQSWLDSYDDVGNNKNVIQMAEGIDIPGILGLLSDLDNAMNHVYSEETRCGVHFILSLLVAAESKIQREKVLFQRFLRDNRYRLASNGITPPDEIFSSETFSTVDLSLVTIWLSTLTPDERERFEMLREAFAYEQRQRDDAIDAEDYGMIGNAEILKKDREKIDEAMAYQLKNNISAYMEQKIAAFVSTLGITESVLFEKRKDLWCSNADCVVRYNEMRLYEKFKVACLHDTDDDTDYARFALDEIEAGQVDCRVGEYGRTYQYVDSTFFPDFGILGDISVAEHIEGFRCAPGISGSGPFLGEINPDDISRGVFDTTWLVAALSMLAAADQVAAAGGLGESLIKKVFIGRMGADEVVSYDSDLGVYCVRLFKGGLWIPVIVDDLLPLMRKDVPSKVFQWTVQNKGVACAHTSELRSLWVSILEKAYAKYYGGYHHLRVGYVQHALEDLTGQEAECIAIAEASRGRDKGFLWESLMRYRKNGYILGANAGDEKLADPTICSMGIVLNETYSIFDVLEMDGHRLLRLRNISGGSEGEQQWRGDWGATSSLWTRRLRHKLQLASVGERMFFMSFDDFCQAFRYVFVCKWHDPSKWKTIHIPCFWQRPLVSTDETRDGVDGNEMLMLESGLKDVPNRSDGDEMIGRKKAELRANMDTSGGVPSRHNPDCMFENNPHFALRIHRPTEVRIAVSQMDSRGRPSASINPVTIFVLRNEGDGKMPVRARSVTKANLVNKTPQPVKERVTSLYSMLSPGLYLVVAAPYIRGMEGNFTISVMSNNLVAFSAVWPPKWVVSGGDYSDGDKGDSTVVAIMRWMMSKAMGSSTVKPDYIRDLEERDLMAEAIEEDYQKLNIKASAERNDNGVAAAAASPAGIEDKPQQETEGAGRQ